MTSSLPGMKMVFCGAAHLDRLGRTNERAVAGTSNPGLFIERPGGAAFNSASVFAALGGAAGLMTILGSDKAASDIRSAAEKRVLVLSAQTGERTGSYTAILEPNGDLVIGLADMAIYDAFDANVALDTVADIDATGWLFLDANLPEETLFKLASTAECRVAVTTTSSAKAPRLRDALPLIDLLFTNHSEAKVLFDARDDYLERALSEADVETIIMTHGADPVLVMDAGKTLEINVSALKDIKDVTGAGDALAGACLFALMDGKSVEQAVKLGVTAAQAILAVDGPWRPDLRHAINELNGNLT